MCFVFVYSPQTLSAFELLINNDGAVGEKKAEPARVSWKKGKCKQGYKAEKNCKQ